MNAAISGKQVTKHTDYLIPINNLRLVSFKKDWETYMSSQHCDSVYTQWRRALFVVMRYFL